MMTEPERKVLASLPDVVTVYRGAGNPAYLSGFSWTLDRARAKWFARRFGSAEAVVVAHRLTRAHAHQEIRPVVAIGRLRRFDVIAYRAGRNEAEIVALPESVSIEVSLTSSCVRGYHRSSTSLRLLSNRVARANRSHQ